MRKLLAILVTCAFATVSPRASAARPEPITVQIDLFGGDCNQLDVVVDWTPQPGQSSVVYDFRDLRTGGFTAASILGIAPDLNSTGIVTFDVLDPLGRGKHQIQVTATIVDDLGNPLLSSPARASLPCEIPAF